MKKLLIIMSLVLITSIVTAQDFRLRSYSSTYSFADKNGNFNDFKVNEIKSNILIVIGKNTITVYAKTITTYNILVVGEVKYDNIGPYSETILLDDEKIQCKGKIYVPNETDSYHVIIEYKNVMFIYNCREEK